GGERVDGGRHEVGGNGERGDELDCREDRRVVLAYGRPQEFPVVRVAGREIDVTPPYPALAGCATECDEPRGLRVVNQDEVAVERKALCFAASPLHVDLAILRGERFGMPVKRVVDLLRHAEETVVPLHDFPGGWNAQLVQDDHQAVQDLRDASPRLGRINHDDAMAL